MNHPESQCRKQRRRSRRSRLASIGVLQVAVAIAVHAPTLASAFAPPQPLSAQIIFPTTSVSGRRKEAVILDAKKKRKKSAATGDSDEIEREVSYRERAQRYGYSIDDNDDDEETYTGEDDDVPNQTTLSGGTPLVFEMARRMLVWDDELYESGMLNDAGSKEVEESASPSSAYLSSLSSSEKTINTLPLPPASSTSTSAPRWRPSAIRQQSISNINPSFRTSSPIMTNAGYAGILRRNSRKKNKPSMWRHCLRTYAKMGELEKADLADTRSYSGSVDRVTPPPTNSSRALKRKRIRRSTAHHEAVLVAASKLGMWEEALSIYRGAESAALNGTASDGSARRGMTQITDNMILSVVNACVKGSKVKRTASSVPIVGDVVTDDTDDDEHDAINATSAKNATKISADVDTVTLTAPPPLPPPSRPMMRALTVEERRKPLDSARDIILSMEEKHDIPLVSRHINPLASAYNRLGLRSEGASMINDHLKERPPPPPAPYRRNYSKKSEPWEKREVISDLPGFEGVKLVDLSDDDLDEYKEDEEEDEDEYSDGYEEIQLNIHEMKSKDRASYSLLVQGAAMDGDWTRAVNELQRMTEAGLHPNSRNLNSWNEVMERGCRPSGNGEENLREDAADYYYGGRRRRSWKKKRDGIWLSNLR